MQLRYQENILKEILPAKLYTLIISILKVALPCYLLGKCKLKTTMRYYNILTEMTIIKKTDNSKHWWGCRET